MFTGFRKDILLIAGETTFILYKELFGIAKRDMASVIGYVY
jgi:hypothetical protein